MLRTIGSLGERLLARVVPQATVQAQECNWYCCNSQCSVVQECCVVGCDSGGCWVACGPCRHD